MQGRVGLPSVRQLLDIYGVDAQRRLSQNFLLHKPTLTRIVQQLSCVRGESVVAEIGPGPGSLSREIMRQHAPRRLVLVEKDVRFAPILEQLQERHPSEVAVSLSDALEMEHTVTDEHLGLGNSDAPVRRLHFVGNLPFSVASPMLVMLLRIMQSQNDSPLVRAMVSAEHVEFVLMFQKEVAQRIVALPGERHRSRLSALVQRYCTAHNCMTVPGSSFVPAPNVDAAVVRLVRRANHPRDIDAFAPFVNVLFSNTRKQIGNAIPRPQRIPSDLRHLRASQLTDSQIDAIFAACL